MKFVRRSLKVIIPVWAAIALYLFPWSTDAELSSKDTQEQRDFYAKAYKTEAKPTDADTTDYTRRAMQLHTNLGTRQKLLEFVAEKNLAHAKGLEVGSGVGIFQDVMEDYTGLDISSSVAQYYKKTFVLGSATAMPFKDNEFDFVFSFYVLEHIPNPEQALRETRRVTKSGGYVYLEPAWNVTRFAAQGYPVRPYSDFGFGGKILKAIQPVVDSSPFRATYVIPARLARQAIAQTGPTTFHYTRLVPNYDKYWMADADAVNTLDRLETALWFTSRGDECMNCGSSATAAISRPAERRLIIKIRK